MAEPTFDADASLQVISYLCEKVAAAIMEMDDSHVLHKYAFLTAKVAADDIIGKGGLHPGGGIDGDSPMEEDEEGAHRMDRPMNEDDAQNTSKHPSNLPPKQVVVSSEAPEPVAPKEEDPKATK
uniref:Vta1 domain-containing protein n=1 Tax=Panagrellus redivivus TaxID=6233 RepID=A0A7E5A233_PANRE